MSLVLGSPRDVLDACGRYTTDAVATVGFGIETSALNEENDHLRSVLKNVFVFNKLFVLLILAVFVDLPLLKILRLSFVHPELALFLRRAIWSSVEERERTGKKGARGDFLDLLMELREKGNIAGDEEDVQNKSVANGNVKHPSTETAKGTANGLVSGNKVSAGNKTLGMRLGLLQSKLGHAHIILNYRLHPCAETPRTMEFNVHSFLIETKSGVPVKFTRV